jgi:hypothetical protein
MTGLPIVLVEDTPAAALGEALAMLRRVDAALEACGDPVLDHVDRIARFMGQPRLTCTSRDGSIRISAWIEAHAFHHRVVGDALWIELRDGDEALRTVEMIRLDGSNRIRPETGTTGIRTIVGNLILPLSKAVALEQDAWTRPALENGVILPHHLDAETEAGLSTFAGMLAVTADVMPEMTVSIVAGRPYAPAQAFGLHGRARDDVDAAASRLSPLIPSQIALAREIREPIPTWRFGPRVLPERPYDVRLSHADALRIASRLPIR